MYQDAGGGVGGFLIATAASGTELVKDVQNLRDIRARVYEGPAGDMKHGINSFYYVFSPDIADLQRSSPEFNSLVRTSTTPLISSYILLGGSLEAGMLVLAVSLLSTGNLALHVGLPVLFGYVLPNGMRRFLKRHVRPQA